TKYDDDHADYIYARVDQGPDSEAPGYFTRSGDAPWVEPELIEVYAVLSDSNTVLTFYYDNQKAERNGMSVGPFYYDDTWTLNQSWYAERDSITTVVFDASFAACTTITSTAYWFDGFKNLKVITGMENLNTSNVTDMSYMFDDCWSLDNLDLSNFNTANVTNMEVMFGSCESLATLNLSNFNTEKVTAMNGMFIDCRSLTSLDLSSFNTENVTDMNGMFSDCYSLTSLDLSSFSTANVTDMRQMFYRCNVLTSLDVSNLNTSNVTDMGGMFQGCNSLTRLDLSNFNTAKVTNMVRMFAGSDGLRTIYVGEGWSTASVTGYAGSEMFGDCFSLVGGMGTKYDADHEDYT
ncbi:MAG: DUF285 domain-containing protein, partial [Prevotella sp.]|nr:DUF285 domain-containing protein [Prevotella sp.]